MQEIVQRLDRIEKALAEIKTSFAAEVRAKNRSRREAYKLRKEKRDEGKVPLPRVHVLRTRDERIQHRAPQWAAAGMRFGRANRPEDFLTWFVYQWNNCCYLKKPLTFSGSSFRVWIGHLRHSYGPLDLMGYCRRRDKVQILRNDAEHDDFTKRPWWDWGYAVFIPTFQAMQETASFSELPERFLRCLRLIMSGYGQEEVYTDLYWDPNESMPNLNKMIRRIGTDLHLMMRACWAGLRVRGTCPVEVPP